MQNVCASDISYIFIFLRFKLFLNTIEWFEQYKFLLCYHNGMNTRNHLIILLKIVVKKMRILITEHYNICSDIAFLQKNTFQIDNVNNKYPKVYFQ